jgi:hypothetical protein
MTFYNWPELSFINSKNISQCQFHELHHRVQNLSNLFSAVGRVRFSAVVRVRFSVVGRVRFSAVVRVRFSVVGRVRFSAVGRVIFSAVDRVRFSAVGQKCLVSKYSRHFTTNLTKLRSAYSSPSACDSTSQP